MIGQQVIVGQTLRIIILLSQVLLNKINIDGMDEVY
jgi:hypothetical protein